MVGCVPGLRPRVLGRRVRVGLALALDVPVTALDVPAAGLGAQEEVVVPAATVVVGQVDIADREPGRSTARRWLDRERRQW